MIQRIILHFVNNSNRHILIVYPILNPRLSRASTVIHKRFVLARSYAYFAVYQLGTLWTDIVFKLCYERSLTFITQLPRRR